MTKKKVWVQAAIDVEDMELAKKIAFMSLDAGAEWLEVGTPLLYRFGHSAIGTLRRTVGPGVVLVADYKSPYAELCARQAAAEGADYVLLSAGYSSQAVRRAVEFCADACIKPIFDLSVHPNDMPRLAQEIASLGAEHVFSRHYSVLKDAQGRDTRVDNISGILSGGHNFKLGITSDDLDEVKSAIRGGADWITFGWVLRSPNKEECKRWIDTIHNTLDTYQ